MRQDITISDGTVVHTLDAFPFDSSPNLVTTVQGYRRGDRAVDAWTMQRTFAQFFSDGVFGTPADAFQVAKASSGLAVTIQPGMAVIQGAMGGIKESDGALTVTLDTAAAAGNVCYGIMLRYDNNSDVRSLGIRVVKGVAGSNPQPPAPDTTSAGVKELRLGYVTVPNGATDLSNATVTNEKGLAACPYAAPFEEIDMSQVTADARASANEALTQLLAYFDQYRDMVDAAIDDTLAGQLQEQISQLKEQVESFSVDLSSEVDDFSIEYTSDNYPTTPKKLRVKDGGIVHDSLSQWLQIELGIADTESWDYGDFKSMAQASQGNETLQTSLMGYLDQGTVTSWTDDQIVEFAGLLVESCQTTFVGYISNSRAQQISATDFAALYNEVGTSAQSALKSKVSLMSYSWGDMNTMHNLFGDSWASGYIGKTKAIQIGAGTYQARLIGVGHDDATDGNGSTLTFQTTEMVTESGMYPISDAYRTTEDSYTKTYICTTLMGQLADMVGADAKPYIREVTKMCSWTRGSTSHDTVNAKMWVMSETELYGSDHPCGRSSPANDGAQYHYWSVNDPDASGHSGSGKLWPLNGQIGKYASASLRTGACAGSYNNHTSFKLQSGGSGSCGVSNAGWGDRGGVVPCFCI